MRVLGTTWGDPSSPRTYSGVPYHLFAELETDGTLVGRADQRMTRPLDLARGALDLRRTLAARRPRRSALWRYLPETIELLTERFRVAQRRMPPHDVTLQFGVAGIPAGPLVAHVEIPVELAISSPVFARSYGFDGLDDRVAARAIEGERAFLRACDAIWTNSTWTADAIEAQGVDRSAIAVVPPGTGIDDPGPVARDWTVPRLLFVGKDWVGKGGPLLVEAFGLLRRARPDATLTIIGCEPDVDQPGVEVLGFLSRDSPRERSLLTGALRQATVFVMPSRWESFGIVYMEAALYGLPIVMSAGQGRETVFPPSMAVVLDDPTPEQLASELVDLVGDPARMARMGEAGHRIASSQHTWPHVASDVSAVLERVAGAG